MDKQPKVSVVIPTLNAAKRLPSLVQALLEQTIPPYEILIIDSSSEDGTIDTVQHISCVQTKIIDRKHFNHGLTRHEAIKDTSGEYICFFTDDAIPANNELIHNLTALFADQQIAMVSGRQIPKPDARRYEQLIRQYNYPPVSSVRSQSDISTLGIKAFFASDACSAYRRSSYLEVGGFEEVNTNEDMLIAARFLNNGYKVAYAADAVVQHSHNLSLKQQYERNKAISLFMDTHQAELGDINATGEGISLVKTVSSQLLKEHNITELIAFFGDCTARYFGNIAGRRHGKKQRKPKDNIHV